MEWRVQRVLIWSGPLMVAVWFVTFVFVMEFFPPSNPSATAQQIVDLYAHGEVRIKIGAVIVMAASALLVPWAVAISGQLKRIRRAKALGDTQMISCGVLSLEFITPIGVWMAASFRYDSRAADVTEAMHDLGWILFVTVIWSAWVQMVAIAAAILIDRRPTPVLPRWMGYLSIWVSMLILPAGLVLFFKSGPFAWNGIVGIYIPLAGFAIWVAALTVAIHRNLTTQIAEDDDSVEVPKSLQHN
ncbi:hypothetical protein TUM20985_39070 [Mycobacterium antarcticum]|uniref:hypothetical protein n=1 Tax=unclassified Mycolicibacterium TaxID=2636767 RepID=UPI0023931F4B|nr:MULTISPECIES: hypothetical protein [unclassified Mycolicibacterium]BDX33360.1 hypothetical protein TUM20985_39070 [Mycolicibacterium sp. TUM20985]GLP83069.1 hypothetical protein TUM20984_44890 [Mycolicibacterium sp. TUM20984]